MDKEDKEKLKQIKVKILDELVGLSDSEDIPAENRFTLIMNQAAGTTDVNLFNKAHSVAVEIKDPSTKARALMDLLEEIDINLGNITTGASPESSGERPSNSDKVSEDPAKSSGENN